MIILYLKLLSLFFCAGLGYIGSRHLNISHTSIASLIIYILSPVFHFYVMASSPVQFSLLWIIPLYTGLCLCVGISAYIVGNKIFNDTRANLMSLGLSTPNLGYYGIPVVLVLYDKTLLSTYILFSLGVACSVYTYGYYIMSRSKYSAKESIQKFLRLPILYATFGGMLFSHLGLKIPAFSIPTFEFFEGAYSLLGLMMIGFGFGHVKKFALDKGLALAALTGKFIVYPAFTLALIFMDQQCFGFFDSQLAKLMVLSSLMPLGINTINFSALLDERPAEAASIVLLSTILSTLLIPLLSLWGLL